jgi:hypothetical protein
MVSRAGLLALLAISSVLVWLYASRSGSGVSSAGTTTATATAADTAGSAAMRRYGVDESETDPSSQRPIDRDRRALNREQPGQLPMFTTLGYIQRPTPGRLLAQIMQYYTDNVGARQRESRGNLDYGFGRLAQEETHPNVVPLSREMQQYIGDSLQPLMEEWAGGVSLRFSMAYGIREYSNHTFLKRHVDRVETHVLSAIIHLAHDVDRPWPLTIVAHDGVERTIDMEPGDLVLYEGARCVHGRPYTLSGRSWTNVFAHFAPAEWTRGEHYARPQRRPLPRRRAPVHRDL